VREADGKVHARVRYLPRPFAEYEDDAAVLQALMDLAEENIRRYPEQYLWLYHRFQNIPPEAPEELRRRYPYYAAVPSPSFFDIRARHKKS
jgi:lauroyl/myristoyl acyltransferase